MAGTGTDSSDGILEEMIQEANGTTDAPNSTTTNARRTATIREEEGTDPADSDDANILEEMITEADAADASQGASEDGQEEEVEADEPLYDGTAPDSGSDVEFYGDGAGLDDGEDLSGIPGLDDPEDNTDQFFADDGPDEQSTEEPSLLMGRSLKVVISHNKTRM